MSAKPWPLSRLRTWWGLGNACSGEMWSPFAESPPRSVAPASTRSTHQSLEVRRDLDPDVGHQPPGLGDQPLHLVERHVGRPVRHRQLVAERRAVAGPALLGRGVGDLGDLAPVVARDAGRSSAGSPPGGGRGARARLPSASSAATRSSSVSPMPTRIPLVNGIRSSPAASIVSMRTRRVLGRRALVDDEVGVDRLEHQPLRGGHLAQPGEVVAGEHAEVRVREQPALERPLAGPDDVGDEVGVAVRRQALGDLRVDLGQLAGEHEQLLGVAPHRLLEALLDLVGRVEVRPDGSRRRSTCSSSGRCARARACSCARR